MLRLVLVLSLMAAAVRADGDKAGAFDYYVLSLSWSPNWCAIEGDRKGSEQCRSGAGYGWVLHGLWPQYEQGWPSHCKTTARPPTRSQTNAMRDIMGTSGLAWYQWKKHGSCSGLSPDGYYTAARQAYEAVNKPAVFRQLKDPVKLPAHVVEEAFLKDNPELTADMITVTCADGYIQEVRICLSKELTPVPCAADAARDCQMKDALFEPVN